MSPHGYGTGPRYRSSLPEDVAAVRRQSGQHNDSHRPERSKAVTYRDLHRDRWGPLVRFLGGHRGAVLLVGSLAILLNYGVAIAYCLTRWFPSMVAVHWLTAAGAGAVVALLGLAVWARRG